MSKRVKHGLLVMMALSLAAGAHAQRHRAVVLAGGGAPCAFQVGMLKGLVCQQGLDFEVIRGTSAGAFNGAFLAMAPVDPNPARSAANLAAEVNHMERVWLDIRGHRDVYRKRFLGAF